MRATKECQPVDSVPAIDTMHEAFLLDLSELLDAERTFATAMPEMFSLARDQQVKQALQQHIAETHLQIDNLDRALTALDAQPAEIPCRAAIRAAGEAGPSDGGAMPQDTLLLLDTAPGAVARRRSRRSCWASRTWRQRSLT
jgi:hypothetical protein